jgi:hypothetical protein
LNTTLLKSFTESVTKRWYPLIDHPVQRALVEDDVRFKVVPAGRRSGKTERAKRYVVKKALEISGNYFVAAPTRDQVKRIYWNDLIALCGSVSKKPPLGEAYFSYTKTADLTIQFHPLLGGSTITLIGLDQPQRIEGIAWHGGVIDEIADVKEGAWELNISPALNTTNPTMPHYRPWCWLIGVPDGLNHYYDMAQLAQSGNPDWKLYTWKSSEILPPDVIESAKTQMSEKQFKQEYEASFETANGRIYYDYGNHNVTDETIEPHEQILWCHDFNFTPMSSAICVRRGDDIYCLDEIVLESATARQAAIEFCDKFKFHKNKSVIVYGDPAGRAGEKHGHNSDYTDIELVLRNNGWRYTRKVKSAAPAIRDRQNAVRAKIMNANGKTSLFVNPLICKYLHKGLATVQTMKGSTFMEQQTDYQHITTAVGYMIDYEFPLRPIKDPIKTLISPTLTYFK